MPHCKRHYHSPTHPVLLNRGGYISCTPLTMPNNFNVHGRDINAWALYNGPPGYPATYIYCPNSGSFLSGFTSGQAFITMAGPSGGMSGYASGFSVIGFYNGTLGTDLGVDCWQIRDGAALTQPYTRFVMIGGFDCHDGISLLATNASLHIEGVELYDFAVQWECQLRYRLDRVRARVRIGLEDHSHGDRLQSHWRGQPK